MTFSEDGAKLRTEAENIEEIKNAITHYFHGEPGKHLGENKECPLCRDMVNYEASESDTKQN
jgi:hypothetical protein